MPVAVPDSVDSTSALLAGGDYIAGRGLATSLFLSLALGRPLFLEGEAGVGKTEVAKVLAARLGRRTPAARHRRVLALLPGEAPRQAAALSTKEKPGGLSPTRLR